MTHWKAKGEHGRTAFKLSLWTKLWQQYWTECRVYLKFIRHIRPCWCNIYVKTALNIQDKLLDVSFTSIMKWSCWKFICNVRKKIKTHCERASNLCWKRPFFKCLQKGEDWSLGFILSYTEAFILTHRCWGIWPTQATAIFSQEWCVSSLPAAWRSTLPKTALGDDNKSTLNRLLLRDPCHIAFKESAEKSFFHFACNSRSICAHLLNSDTQKQMITFQKFILSLFFQPVWVTEGSKQAIRCVDTDAWLIVLQGDWLDN